MTDNKSVLKQTSVGVPKIALLLIALLVVILVAVLLMGRLASASTAGPGSPDFVQAAQVFTPGQPLTITAENITIYVPRDSLNLPGTISVSSQEPNLFPAADQLDWTRPQIVEVLFLNTQATPVHQIVFANPVHVCFGLMPEQWDDYSQRPDAYQVQYYAVENNPQAWQSLPMTAYADKAMLCGETLHFSLFALAIRVDTGVPVTGLTPTSVTIGVRPTREQPVIVPTSPPPTTPPQPTDPQPTDPPPTDERPADPPGNGSDHKECRDEVDNDSDGLIDMEDPGCRNQGDDNEGG